MLDNFRMGNRRTLRRTVRIRIILDNTYAGEKRREALNLLRRDLSSWSFSLPLLVFEFVSLSMFGLIVLR
jgi:hypothetical protein